MRFTHAPASGIHSANVGLLELWGTYTQERRTKDISTGARQKIILQTGSIAEVRKENAMGSDVAAAQAPFWPIENPARPAERLRASPDEFLRASAARVAKKVFMAT